MVGANYPLAYKLYMFYSNRLNCRIYLHLMINNDSYFSMRLLLFALSDIFKKKPKPVVVPSLSYVQLFVTLWTAARQAPQSFTIFWNLLKPVSIESVMPSNHLILFRPLLLLPSIFPSIRVFSNELDLRIRWLKYWSFSFSLSPSSEYSGLISCRMDWLDLLAKELSKIFSNCIVQRHHFFGTQPSFSSSCHIHTCYCCCYVASVMLDSV